MEVHGQQRTSRGKPDRCSFCDKPQAEPPDFIWGPEVRICEECVDICNDIVAEKRMPERTSPDERIHCVLCRLEWPQEQAVPVPEKGWLCQGCFSEIRSLGDSTERRTP